MSRPFEKESGAKYSDGSSKDHAREGNVDEATERVKESVDRVKEAVDEMQESIQELDEAIDDSRSDDSRNED